jgi:hypothetical protein
VVVKEALQMICKSSWPVVADFEHQGETLYSPGPKAEYSAKQHVILFFIECDIIVEMYSVSIRSNSVSSHKSARNMNLTLAT